MKLKAEQTKHDLLIDIAQNPNLDTWDKLQLAFNHGYSAGYKDGETPNPLYNHKGKQIREVTLSELDWTH